MSKKELPADYEFRTIQTAVECREAEGAEPKGFGHFAVFNQRTEIWPGFFEEVDPGAFDDVLKDDVRVLIDHTSNLIIARTKAGTARLGKDETGATVEFDFPKTTRGADLKEDMRNGNITEMSFGFSVKEDKWTDLGDGKQLRTILKLKHLYDVSPVTFAAYPQTDVALRSLDEWRKAQDPEPDPTQHPDDDLAIGIRTRERERKLKLLKDKSEAASLYH